MIKPNNSINRSYEQPIQLESNLVLVLDLGLHCSQLINSNKTNILLIHHHKKKKKLKKKIKK